MEKGMKGAYIVRLNLDEPHLLGVARKIRAQISSLSMSGMNMDLYFLKGEDISKNDTVLRRYGSGSLWRRLTYYFMFYFFIAKNPLTVDFIYIRYQRSSPVFLYMLSRLKSRYPNLVVLIEVPSYPYHTEENSIRDKLFGLIDRSSRRYLHYYVDRIVTFSKETEIFGIRTIRTDNGVDVDQLKLASTSPQTDHIRLVGVANLSFWHGYDRIISGFNRYYSVGGTRHVLFDIIGSGQEQERLQHDVLQAGLQDYVTFFGPLHGKPLRTIIDRGHIGISSIGMHRLEVDTSNLKSREFCASGIPFIMGYQDQDFNENLPFVFHVLANDDPVDIQAILDFYDGLVTKLPDFRRRMREYAKQHLTWHVKMEPVVSYIRDSVPEQNL